MVVFLISSLIYISVNGDDLCSKMSAEEYLELESKISVYTEKKQYNKVVKTLKSSSHQNNADALFTLATLIQAGYDTTLLPNEINVVAKEKYWHAARCGQEEAIYYLQSIYEFGWLDVKKNLPITKCLRSSEPDKTLGRKCYQMLMGK